MKTLLIILVSCLVLSACAQDTNQLTLDETPYELNENVILCSDDHCCCISLTQINSEQYLISWVELIGDKRVYTELIEVEHYSSDILDTDQELTAEVEGVLDTFMDLCEDHHGRKPSW